MTKDEAIELADLILSDPPPDKDFAAMSAPALARFIRASVGARACRGTEMSDWQPIETAPKDGRQFLMVRFGWEAQPTYNVVYFDEEHPNYPWAIQDSDTAYHPDFPTHWMPLPEPPQEGQAEALPERSEAGT